LLLFFCFLYGYINTSFTSLHLPFIEGGICSCLISSHHEENSTADDEDVLEEENAVRQQLTRGVVDANVAVQVHGIVKTYPGTFSIGCCCKCKRTAPYHALKVKHFLSQF
jgi:hypothetical protein